MVVSQACRGPKGICLAVMAAKAGVVLKSSSALACTVDSAGRKLSASSTRLQFGHLVVTEFVAKLHLDHGKGTYPYYGYPDANQGDTIVGLSTLTVGIGMPILQLLIVRV
jgi:hypothetical protein